MSTFQFRNEIEALSWVSKNERYFISGSKDGRLRLHDSKENKTIWELGNEEGSLLAGCRYVYTIFLSFNINKQKFNLYGHSVVLIKFINFFYSRILSLCCSPTECTVTCSAVNSEGFAKLLLYDIKSRKLEVKEQNRKILLLLVY